MTPVDDRDGRQRAPYDGYVIAYAPGEAPSMAHRLAEETELLRAVLHALGALDEPREAPTRLVDRREAAAMFGVSEKTLTRWVKPTSQTRKRGRAWYDPADVERQLRALGPAPGPRVTSAAQPKPKRAPKHRARAARAEPSTEARVAAIELRLKDGSSNSARRSRS
jgi:hypothetical protein